MSKATDAFRTISEVAEDLDLPQHVLRFWETRFKQIKPMKRGGGRRYYRPDDVELLRGIKGLLYDEGYTIRGVQRLLKEHGNRVAIEFGRSGSLDLETSGAIETEMDSAVGGTSVDSIAPTPAPKSAGILSRIASKVTPEDSSTGASGTLSKADLSILQSTLQELLECKRLLDQTRQN